MECVQSNSKKRHIQYNLNPKKQCILTMSVKQCCGSGMIHSGSYFPDRPGSGSYFPGRSDPDPTLKLGQVCSMTAARLLKHSLDFMTKQLLCKQRRIGPLQSINIQKIIRVLYQKGRIRNNYSRSESDLPKIPDPSHPIKSSKII